MGKPLRFLPDAGRILYAGVELGNPPSPRLRPLYRRRISRVVRKPLGGSRTQPDRGKHTRASAGVRMALGRCYQRSSQANVTATMVTVREHYDEVLSQYYSRMFGDFETKVGEQQTLLE